MKKAFTSFTDDFAYFYSYIGYRLPFTFVLSFAVGILDGLGLAMFLPMLEMLDNGQTVSNAESMGNLGFIITSMESIGVPFTLQSVLGVLSFFFVFKGLAKFFESYFKVKVQQIFVRKLRTENVNYLANYDYQKFISMDVGRIQNTMSGEIERIISAYKSFVGTLQASVVLFVYIALAYLANAEFALLVTFGGVVSNFAFRTIYNRTKQLSRELTKGGHLYQLLMIQMIHSFKYLKATSLVDVFTRKVENLTNEIEESKRKVGLYDAILSSVREPIVVLIVVVVILIEVTYLNQNLGLIILSLLFFYRALTFVMKLQTEWNAFLKVSGSLENMRDFQQELIEGEEKLLGKEVHSLKDGIVLENVDFSFGQTLVLNNISLDIPKNKTVAFVGESGSGKTTLVNLIAGLLQPVTGYVKIDGIDLNRVDIKEYRARIGYITQEPVIFNDTVFNNVTFWSDKSSESQERFWKSLDKASIYSFVNDLKYGEDSILGSNGVNLSGGQRQRLSIAREMYKDIDVLIMDEATSALDSQTEKEIQNNIDSLRGQYTILMVAHRLSTIRNADLVVLLDKGSIIDIGSYDMLLKRSKLFKKMVDLQEL
ncbi:ABC transporter ATP-binding protein [Roseivirga sp. E12]|uniref:ABC transporter ATP-binding protein n=1 Tax=Roseivirga sp. E12 TaxID=2819237 RepID=UPI001ABC9281|nr:ABC transporter ATP-binding protein [Roseivirga sp. E12]MBO3698389.1 ABC transporter ATP-binding protein [Roseivirga sp. E12]